MKHIIRIIAVILSMTFAVNAYAAKNYDITLVVTSDGATKDEAIKNALRSAIEQTYGVFVSANTDILNDEIVSDEIATIASGNIKSYKEISETPSDSKTTVTLEAVVSVGKLISYVKSKGAECELDGEAMFADIELQKLYTQNEEKAIENLITQISELFEKGYDYELKINKAKSEYTGYHTDSYGYTHYGTYAPDNGNPDDVCMQYNIKIKINSNGARAWKELEKALKHLGKESTPSKIVIGFPSSDKMEQIAEQYPAQLMIPTSNTSYGATGKIFNLRSQRSVIMINNLINQLPSFISNVSLDCGGHHYNISQNMQFVDENAQPAAQEHLMRCRAMNKKDGQNCGEFRGFINLPLSVLKQTKSIKVVPGRL